MAKTVFIRVELVGNTDRSLYDSVHAVMVDDLKWNRYVYAKTDSGKVKVDLPTAMYAGEADKSPLEVANSIESLLKPIWHKPLVLVMRPGDDWGVAGG